MKSQDIAVVGILLAVGAIVRYLSLVIPGPIVSNLVIAFYCLAVILVVPSFKEALGIGAVAGVVCAMISHSIFPPANLISEPIGAVVCLLVYLGIRGRLAPAPGLSTFLGTLASGFTFVAVAMVMVAPAIATKYTTMGAFAFTIIPIVVITAVVNAFIAQILYLPGSRVVTGSRREPRGIQVSRTPVTPSVTENESILLEASDFTYTYEGANRPALRGIDLTVKKGEILLVTGPTAAGKTTLCLALAGILHHESKGTIEGRISFRGRDIGAYHGMGELSRSIGVVFDDADAQLIFTTVEEEITSGLANRGLTPAEIEKRLSDAMERTGITHLRSRAPHTLSGGQKQRVALAATLALDTDLLILDESTAELDTAATRTVIDILTQLRAEGKSIIVVDHNTDEFLGVADRAVVLEGGRVAAVGIPGHVLKESSTTSTAPCNRVPVEVNRTASPIISVAGLFQQFGEVRALDGVDLDIYPGEFIAIIGENGSGKTTLVKHFNGLLHPTTGMVKVNGDDTRQTPVTELVQHSGLVFQNPDTMLFEDTAAEEVAFGLRNVGRSATRETISEMLDLVGLGEKNEVYPRHLSRGERQRLAVACILAMHPEVIILDEPTTGLDAAESDRMMALMEQLNERGHTIVMVTHNMRIVRDYAHRIISMDCGRIIDDRPVTTGVCA